MSAHDDDPLPRAAGSQADPGRAYLLECLDILREAVHEEPPVGRVAWTYDVEGHEPDAPLPDRVPVDRLRAWVLRYRRGLGGLAFAPGRAYLTEYRLELAADGGPRFLPVRTDDVADPAFAGVDLRRLRHAVQMHESVVDRVAPVGPTTLPVPLRLLVEPPLAEPAPVGSGPRAPGAWPGTTAVVDLASMLGRQVRHPSYAALARAGLLPGAEWPFEAWREGIREEVAAAQGGAPVLDIHWASPRLVRLRMALEVEAEGVGVEAWLARWADFAAVLAAVGLPLPTSPEARVAELTQRLAHPLATTHAPGLVHVVVGGSGLAD